MTIMAVRLTTEIKGHHIHSLGLAGVTDVINKFHRTIITGSTWAIVPEVEELLYSSEEAHWIKNDPGCQKTAGSSMIILSVVIISPFILPKYDTRQDQHYKQMLNSYMVTNK